MSGPVLDLLARALDPARPAPPDDATSERILDGALAVAAASGLRHLTMDEVARRAAVGRMTVYRRFGDRDSLVDALTVRETRRGLASLDAAAPVDAPIAEQVACGFVESLRIAREHPLLNRLAQVEPESLLEALRGDGGAVLAMARMFVAARLRAAQEAGVLSRERDADAAAELLVRVMFSFVLVQDTVLPLENEAAARSVAERLVVPLVTG